jgi:tetratricopeptide (TPR) repeat protein
MVEDAISFWTDIQRYEDMLAANPSSPCFAPLSELYRKLGLLEDAVSVAQKGCALHPDSAEGFAALGAACYAKGLAEQARVALERVAALKPEDMQSQKLLGQLYVEIGEIDLAQKVLKRVLQQNADDLESTMLLGSIGSTGGAPESEEELLEDADIIEDLTELFDQELAETATLLADAEPTPPFPAEAGVVEGFEESDDLWDLGGAEESGSPELVRAFEDVEDFQELQSLSQPGRSAAAARFSAPAASVAAAEPAGQHAGRDPLTTATLAELYVSQGFIDKALNIYCELVAADPGNQCYLLRCAELKELRQRQQEAPLAAALTAASQAPAAQEQPKQELSAQEPSVQDRIAQPIAQSRVAQEQIAQPSAAQEQVAVPQKDAEAELCCWLENIRRRRDGV